MKPVKTWTIEGLLRERTEEVGECHEWLGTFNSGNHPQVCFHGKQRLARRVAGGMAQGVSLDDLAGPQVVMKCGNDRCISPSHMKCGTQRQMFAWMTKAGRMKPGPERIAKNAAVARARSNLTIEDVRTIRREAANGAKHYELAARYGKSSSLINRIVSNQCWREGMAASSVFNLVAS